ncbi:MAG TPA: DUF938 domain-containing protein [Erythrobacter sp.]|nr:DUF938 domain-containing protein [Erythrobacter sp.]
MKRRAPATERNRDPLADVLARELPESGLVLEVASGTGEHAFHFAGRFPTLDWQPSDPDADARASIAAWRAEYEGSNLRAPLELDAASSDWPIAHADAILCVNMVHISPWEATMGLIGGAARLLKQGAPLILYGPYFEDGIETAPSNLAFDASLKERNSHWGLRKLADVDVLARQSGFVRTARYAMPANNLTLVYRRN